MSTPQRPTLPGAPAGPVAVGILLPGGDRDGGLRLHGLSLAAHARRSLAEAGVRLLGEDAPWWIAQEAGLPVVLHDPRCPGTPAAFVAELVRRAATREPAEADPADRHPADAVLAGVRPVTDTIKTATADVVGRTVDRDGLVDLAAPVVLPASLAAALERRPAAADAVELVRMLSRRFPVLFVEAPPVARRVQDAVDVLLLEALLEKGGSWVRGGQGP